MVFERPNRPGKPKSSASNQPNPTTQRADSGKQKKVIQVGGGNRGKGGGSNRPPERPPDACPWLDPANIPEPASSASFVEYLRWLRSPTANYKDPTKIELLHLAQDKADYRHRLQTLVDRTKLIAGEGNWFTVSCPWRIRVGGTKGPESILLPAFDALGMPYIPSSTLRGVARTQAIHHFMRSENLEWKQAEEKVTPYFGSLKAEGSDHTGKVIFLDAYPLAEQSRSGGLSLDSATSIWRWGEVDLDEYKPNPNAFFSLEHPTFTIGLRPSAQCSDKILQQVRQWLIQGLVDGIGSQVNTGYGTLENKDSLLNQLSFFEVEFTVQGQLIHGSQKIASWKQNQRGEWQARNQSRAEVRSVAFKSMLRYWFRTFARGLLPVQAVKDWESKLFGSINPKQRGWVRVQIAEGQIVQTESRSTRDGKQDPCGEQSGRLVLSFAPEISKEKQEVTQQLFELLTWLMFHLGGIGQGARRPCYSRKTRPNAPWWRGSTLIAKTEDEFWDLPENVVGFQILFRQRLQKFCDLLSELTQQPINLRNPLSPVQPSRERWTEALDSYARIIVCDGEENYGKPYALSVLHDEDFKQPRMKAGKETKDDSGQVIKDYDPTLCGSTLTKPVRPSPVWIVNLGNYQVVTIFGATQDPRKKYFEALKQHASEYQQIFPLT
ncbi:MAG: type III-B CRISPR module RAMP protein Cmr6 [Myxacorys californica WJT36-NPBG1]|jgi:CRISPR-associated protein Cmr6|nr:type III-B CRISPR module RAMP protein Cmr6 [Myxacorys californica WJT36-NPBG1]